MFRTLDVVMVAAVIAAASWTFKVKYDSEAAKARVAKLEKRLEIEKEAIDILNADWSLLTSPDRLKKLVERYQDDLQLQPTEPEMVGTLDDVPMADQMPAEVQDRMREAQSDGAADRGTITGSIKSVGGKPGEDDPAEDGAVEEMDQ
ncbi:MAG: hypothetical protein LJE67_04270 [Salaquimonas sp.]|jgi:hypothetical protein|nr:hypothetical protein [Salaquimonas sp.]